MKDVHTPADIWRIADQAPFVAELFGHPDDVLADRTMTVEEKRALLSSWASDANAVPHLPTLRQLPDGSIVQVDRILYALKALDASRAATPALASDSTPWQRPFKRRRGWAVRRWSRNRGRPDDDDPPLCPAGAALRPRGGGGGAAAYPEAMQA